MRPSPLNHANSIHAPVLLVHGKRDRTAPLEESERFADGLREFGREVELLVIPDAAHVFNSEDRGEAASA